MVQCKFRVKIISVIFKIHVCLHWAMSWPVSSFFHGRREWVGFFCCHLYVQPSPVQKILAHETRPSNSALNCREFTFYICKKQVMFKLRDKNNVQHQKRASQVLYYLCHCFRFI